MKDLGSARDGEVSAWYREQDGGFNSIQYQQAAGDDLEAYGLESDLALTDSVRFRSRIEHEQRGEQEIYDESGLQLEWQFSDRVRIAGEYLAERDQIGGEVDTQSSAEPELPLIGASAYQPFSMRNLLSINHRTQQLKIYSELVSRGV